MEEGHGRGILRTNRTPPGVCLRRLVARVVFADEPRALLLAAPVYLLLLLPAGATTHALDQTEVSAQVPGGDRQRPTQETPCPS